jgi:hypothetical protein
VCCLFALLALIGPRVAFLFGWLVDTSHWDGAIPSFWVKLLGLVFLPWTALFWVLAWSPTHGVSGFGWFVVVMGFVIDVSSYTSGAYSRRG